MKALIKVYGKIRVVQVTGMQESSYIYYYGDSDTTAFYNLHLVPEGEDVDHSYKDCVLLKTPNTDYIFSIDEMNQFEWFIRELYENGKVDLTEFTCKPANSFER